MVGVRFTDSVLSFGLLFSHRIPVSDIVGLDYRLSWGIRSFVVHTRTRSYSFPVFRVLEVEQTMRRVADAAGVDILEVTTRDLLSGQRVVWYAAS